MNTIYDLDTAARAADPNVIGVALLGGSTPIQDGWTVVTRADGVRVRLDTADGSTPTQAARGAVMDLDLTPDGVAVRQAVAARLAANAAVASDPSPRGVAVRGGLAAVWQQLNDQSEVLKAVSDLAGRGTLAPTGAQLRAQLDANRAALASAGTPVDANATPTATIAARFGVRLQQPEVLALTHGAITTGEGDPLPPAPGS